MALKEEIEAKVEFNFYHMDINECSIEQLVQHRSQLNFLIQQYEREIWLVETALLGEIAKTGGTALYGPSLEDGTPEWIAEKKVSPAKYTRTQFKALEEIFTKAEWAECYIEPWEEKLKPKQHAEDWKTTTVEKYANKHGGKALEIFAGAKQKGTLTLEITWMKEGGEIDEGRN